MRITKVEVSNIRGIELFEMSPGAVTVIRGANGIGKSSLMDAIKAPFEKGYDPSLLRNGAEEGFVKLTLDDGSRIVFEQDERGNDVKYYPSDSKKTIKAARTFVQGLEDSLALDPLKFLRLEPKQRIAYLLEHSPVQFLPEEVAKATGRSIRQPLKLDGIDALRESIYEERRTANVAADQASKTAESLKAQLGEEDATDWSVVESEKRNKLEEAKAARSNIETVMRAEMQSEISKLSEDFAAQIKALEDSRDQAIATLKSGYENSIRSQSATYDSEIETLVAEHIHAREKAQQQQRSAGTRKQIDQFATTAKAAEQKSEKLTAELKAIDTLKAKKLKEDGIPGMEFGKGEIYVDGIKFDAVNRAERFKLAINICKRGAGELPLMLVDDADCLVGDDWEEFVKIASESGMQVVISRAEAVELDVEVAA
jgi:predicted ATP-dependent endonuclease of OLD family